MSTSKIPSLAIRPETVFAPSPAALRTRQSPSTAPSRPSGLQAIPAAGAPKYKRRDFYLKIKGLTGPRDNSSSEHEQE